MAIDEGSGRDQQADIYELQEVLRIFIESELHDLTIEFGDVRLSASKGRKSETASSPSAPPPPVMASAVSSAGGPSQTSAAPGLAAVDQPSATEVVDEAGAATIDVLSPSGGLFYRCPAPGEPPYVEVGDKVEADDTLCLVEIMKMFTEVRAPVAGTVVGIYVDSEDVVTQDVVLMRIQPDTDQVASRS
jgi:acetyl-CoA carboxylase biotin carboxyl carrier protein